MAVVCMYIMTLQCDIYLTLLSAPSSDNVTLPLSFLIFPNIPFKLTTVTNQASQLSQDVITDGNLQLEILRRSLYLAQQPQMI